METQITLLQSREMARRTEMEMKNAAMAMGGIDNTAFPKSDDIQKAVKATNPPGTRLLNVTAEAADPTQARDLANATARAFVAYKRDLATRDMSAAEQRLAHEAALAGQAMDQAERQEQLSKQAPVPSDAARLAENTEVAKELYQRLEMALSATKLQRDLVSADVTITQYADVPKTPS